MISRVYVGYIGGGGGLSAGYLHICPPASLSRDLLGAGGSYAWHDAHLATSYMHDNFA